jgi:mannosyltransferase OCH1-like enzyme
MAIEETSSSELDTNRIVQGLWIGPELSRLEQLSIASFLHHGHDYHLYVYDRVGNIPAGVTINNGNEILPASSIFQYQKQASYAGFANFFRYKLLLERGGWWVDTDLVCLKPFDFPAEHVFATEVCEGREVVNSGIIKAPAGSPVMDYAWSVCRQKDPQQLVWGETGPKLMQEAVGRFAMERCCQPHSVFCPLAYYEWQQVLEPDADDLIDDRSYAIHLWNEMWRKTSQDKNASYDEQCLFERLKQRYLGD